MRAVDITRVTRQTCSRGCTRGSSPPAVCRIQCLCSTSALFQIAMRCSGVAAVFSPAACATGRSQEWLPSRPFTSAGCSGAPLFIHTPSPPGPSTNPSITRSLPKKPSSQHPALHHRSHHHTSNRIDSRTETTRHSTLDPRLDSRPPHIHPPGRAGHTINIGQTEHWH